MSLTRQLSTPRMPLLISISLKKASRSQSHQISHCTRTRPLQAICSRHHNFLAKRNQRPQRHTKFLPRGQLRFANSSSRSESVADARSYVTRSKNFLLRLLLAFGVLAGYYYVTDTRASIHSWLFTPLFRLLYPDAEDAHEAGTRALKALHSFGIHPRERAIPMANLEVEIFGHTLNNPIGISAGLDKHCDIPDALLALGPAIVEIGGVTPLPQAGNEKPRVWRLPSQRALINRYGLNSEGASIIASRLRKRVREYAYAMGFGIDEEAEQRVLDGYLPASLSKGKLLAVQVAKQKSTPDGDIEAVKRDYVYCVDTLARYVDIIVVNVSSPNTPGLRGLQKVEPLTSILTAVVNAAGTAKKRTKPAVMVKISPDESSEDDIRGVCEAVWASGVDGVICGNTTTSRPDPLPQGYSLSEKEARILSEQGGYSGPQLFDKTVQLVRRYREILDEGSNPIDNEESLPKPSSATSSFSLLPTVSALDSPEATKLPTTQEDIEATVARDTQRLKPETEESRAQSQSQPLIQIPEHNNPFATSPSPPPSSPPSSSPQKIRDRKIICASGGISSGAQALEVLAAGADIVQIYTAMVYGGVGTVTRIKQEMSEEMRRVGERKR